MGEYERVFHTLEPVYDEKSRILILGSFPSVKSRETKFYYGLPQNRFWKLLLALFDEGEATREFIDIQDKQEFLKRHHIALWDVIASCEIKGSSDSSIRNVKANDINQILKVAPITQIITNGATANRLYMKYCFPDTQRVAIQVPSTSPANAVYGFKRLLEAWEKVLNTQKERRFRKMRT